MAATNPWDINLTVFFSAPQQQTFQDYRKPVVDKSIVTKLFSPLWNWIAHQIPTYVAPNVLNLASLLCLLQAFYLNLLYIETQPTVVSIVALLLVLAYHTLDAVSTKYAKIIDNSSPLSELFQYACTSVGVVFTSLTLSIVLGIPITQISTLWYVVQISQLICLREHIQAFKRGYVQISVLGGEGEIIWLIVILIFSRAVFGLEPFHLIVDFIITYICENPIAALYYLLFLYSLYQSLTLLPYGSRNGVIFCLLYRAVPAILIYFNLFSERTLLDIVCDGLFISIITTDLIVAKMAGRDLHPWIVIMAMASLLSNFFCLFLVFFYYITILSETALFMNLPLFTVVRNVYVDGIYDLCHLGHKLAFKNALKFGTRLFVGVVNDEEATQYKRRPIMRTEERMEAVAACKYVHKVIPNAPCFGVDEEFVRRHNIHVVACSEEYDKPDDTYYKVPRRLGILKILPRTKGMSTSELIRRVVEYGEKLKSDEAAANKEAARVEKDKRLNEKKF